MNYYLSTEISGLAVVLTVDRYAQPALWVVEKWEGWTVASSGWHIKLKPGWGASACEWRIQ